MPNTEKKSSHIKTKVAMFSLGCLTSFFGFLILIIILFVLLIFVAGIEGYFDQKECDKTGHCAKYTTIITNDGKEIEITKRTCLENKGEWFKEERVCVFKNSN